MSQTLVTRNLLHRYPGQGACRNRAVHVLRAQLPLHGPLRNSGNTLPLILNGLVKKRFHFDGSACRRFFDHCGIRQPQARQDGRRLA